MLILNHISSYILYPMLYGTVLYYIAISYTVLLPYVLYSIFKLMQAHYLFFNIQYEEYL